MDQRNHWFKEGTTCVVLCGGKGSRLFPLSLDRQKSMLEINNKPVLHHLIEYWKNYADKFIFVVKHQKQGIIDYVKSLPIQSEFIEPEEIRGLADAVNCVKNHVGSRFFIVLGDCICQGKFNFPEEMEQGVGVCKATQEEHIARSYSVELSDEKTIKKVVEKPQHIPNDLCGMGFYFFNRKIFYYIERMKGRSDEITDIIQCMIDAGEKITNVMFEGEYLNITYPNDLEKAKEIFND